MKKTSRMALGVCLLVLAAVLVFVLWRYVAPSDPAQNEPPPVPTTQPEPELPMEPPEEQPEPSDPEPSDEVDGLPVGKLVITPERRAYESGQITLRIPKLDLVRSIYNGTDADTLSKGVGLYEYAQLPGEGNRNVSLAGHRNGRVNGKVTDNAPFYYIDTMEDGDYVYLVYNKQIYRYLFESLTIVEEDDWTPICTTGESCVTITSCHPIGISDHRIVLRAVLDEVAPEEEDYVYLTHAKEEPQNEIS